MMKYGNIDVRKSMMHLVIVSVDLNVPHGLRSV
jgi:hypothetical protein